MALEFGRVTNLDDLKVEPLEVTIIGYTKDKEEVSETFLFKPVEPTGTALDVLRQADSKGNVPLKLVIQFLDDCLLNKEEFEKWSTFLSADGVYIQPETLAEVYKGITEIYGQRPTKRRSSSTGGRYTPKQIS